MTFSLKPKSLTAFRGYTLERLSSDMMSGLIVGIVALPLAIAFGIASGVSPEEGILTSIIGGFIIAAFGGCSVQVGGPSGSFIVVVVGIIAQYGLQGLMIATVLAGIILALMGLLKMGALIRFIPYPLIVGFTSGLALTIFSTQVKDLFGLTTGEIPGDFIGKWIVYGEAIGTINPLTLLYGVLTIAIIVLTPRFSKRIPGSLVAIVLITVVTYLMRNHFGLGAIETIGDRFTINASFPAPRWIEFDFTLIRELLPAGLTIAMLSAIESLLSSTVADGMMGDKSDTNMELVAQGAANIVVPFFGGIPVAGAIARTMTNVNNGGRSPISGITHAFILLLVLLFLGPLTSHIPMACLAGILTVVSYNMSEWRTIKRLLKGSRADVSILVVTFLLTVFFDLSIALVVGMMMAMVLFLRRISEVTQVSVVRSTLDLSHEGEVAHDEEVLTIADGVEVYSIDGPFFFGIASKFDSVMQSISETAKVRVIRMRRVPFMDSTGVHNLQSLVTSSQESGIKVILSGVNESVRKTLNDAGFREMLGENFICDNITEALARANEFVENAGLNEN